jgi:conjugative relaxase-like TrwC/TraI family protein
MMWCVLSVAKLTPGQERYYERTVADGIDDYYAGRGESPGIWFGRGSAELELSGMVEEGQLGALIRGDHPLTGRRLRRRHPRARTITVERIDPSSGERRLQEKTLRPVAGFDLVFSVPKSVSLVHALGDEETQRAINEAHVSAWHAAMSYLEDEACVVRRGTAGVAREQAPGFVAAAYQHRTSRAQDPHLHTHVIVANMACRPSDGKWRALDGEAILKTYRLAAGYLYEAHLRAELSCSLGVEWETPQKGWSDLRGVPRGVIAEFSSRRAQVVAELGAKSTAGFYAAQIAALQTRDRKEQVDLAVLREDWRARAAEHGFGRAELAATLHQVHRRELSSEELLEIARHLLGPEGLTEQSTAFSDPDLVMAWAAAHAQGASVERVRRLAARFPGMNGIERVGEDPQPGRPARYSTSELIATERDALALVDRGRNVEAPSVPIEALKRTLAEHGTLSGEQVRMLREVATSGDRVLAVVGLAGAGKTTATRAIADAFDAGGIPVLGAAPSGVAAEKLQDETGIPSTTLHRLLNTELPDGCLVVIDEAGMAETRVLAPLLGQVEYARGKALLIGDPQQLPAVGAGGLLGGIVERYGAIELTENRRQHDPDERQALEAVRNGLGRDYLAFAEGKGRLIAADTPVATKTRLVADWWAAAGDDPAGAIMIALRRRDVAELNALARVLMDTHGWLGRERLVIEEREFARGDRVVCLRNSDALGVKNGTRGTVEAVDVDRHTALLATDRGDRVELSESYLRAGNVRHAYALTGHAGQGVTVERAFVLASGELRLQEWGYVALSRARQQTRVYVTANVRERESHFHDLDDRDLVTRFAQALEESAVERLAIDQHPLPSGPKHDARAEIARSTPSELRLFEARQVAQQRLALSKVRADAERRLADAERALKRGRRFGGRRTKDALMSEIALQRATVKAADDRLNAVTERAHHLRNVSVLSKPAAVSARRNEDIPTLIESPSCPVDMDL